MVPVVEVDDCNVHHRVEGEFPLEGESWAMYPDPYESSYVTTGSSQIPGFIFLFYFIAV